MKQIRHKVDFCVIGGGLAGMCAAIAAARRGVRVALMHDRPVLGGNASSEIRMWICGAAGAANRETGIIEEIQLENLYRNNPPTYAVWDSILYEFARFEPNITLLLNCVCLEAEMAGNRIRSVKGRQLTTETWHTVESNLYADCSGDSILAPLSGAEYRVGREARAEFNEDIEPLPADKKTMGMSCLLQAAETGRPQIFIPPKWAAVFKSDDDLPLRNHDLTPTSNFWWIELGGENDSIHDTETLRDELLKITYGVWDHIKNHGNHGADNWVLDWVGFLPGKRESRRYVGDVIMNQNDVLAATGHFEDIIAYGGWPMDDHHPAGFRHPGTPTIFHPAPSPYGIPYRCLYSRNVENLFCAGRNISVSHAALSSTRVMATCATLGQAAGTAAAIACREMKMPRNLFPDSISELQQTLMEDDCYLPWQRREMPALTRRAKLSASKCDPEPLRNGVDRPVENNDNGWNGSFSDWIEYSFERVEHIREARFVFDSDLNKRPLNMPCHRILHPEKRALPARLMRNFRLEIRTADGWKIAAQVRDNTRRMARIPINLDTNAIRFHPELTWGADNVHLFAWDIR